MGCLGSTPNSTENHLNTNGKLHENDNNQQKPKMSNAKEKKGNEQINIATNKYKELQQHKYKILILGAGESGKTTILKQMRYLHGQQYQESDYMAAKVHISQNIIEAMRTLAIYSDILADHGCETNVAKDLEEIRQTVARLSDKETFGKEYYDNFKILLEDNGIQKTLTEYSSQFQLIDTANYLFNKMDKFCEESYVPTFEDIIHCRERTVGVNKLRFMLKDAKSSEIQEIYEIFDVGGQKNERRKWIHFFDNTTAMIFVVALSGYNQTLWENNRNNRMREAIGLFRGIINMEVFKKTSVIMFLNKSDLFDQKIKKFSIKKNFEDYNGDIHDRNQIIEFFKKKFLDQRNTEMAKNKTIFWHITCATDTECIKNMFQNVREIIIQKDMENFF